jgi:glucoamylase
VLKVTTPRGPCWRRYNHDGYGQRADGAAFNGSGVGRPWPLLTAERGHYELAAGRDARPYLSAMQRFSVGIGLIPEQIWDQEARPEKLLWPGGATGAAMPLVWAHAEYIKLARSIADQRVVDRVDPVSARYGRRREPRPAPPEVWCTARKVTAMSAGPTLRVVADAPFTLRCTVACGTAPAGSPVETAAAATQLGIWYVDAAPSRPDTRICFQLLFPTEHPLGVGEHTVDVDRRPT